MSDESLFEKKFNEILQIRKKTPYFGFYVFSLLI